MTEAASQISENWQRKMVFSINRLGKIVPPKKKKKKKETGSLPDNVHAKLILSRLKS